MAILRKHWALAFVVVLSLVTTWVLFLPGYFSHHDDLQTLRIFEMRKCIVDQQIPCRWVPDMGYGYGYPLFNYYNPGIYYIGAVLSYAVGYLGAVKVLFMSALLLGPLGVYFLVQKLWGELPAVIGASLFIFAPYRALDIYARGALSELFALALAPFIFLLMLGLSEKRTRLYTITLSLVFGLFLITHNVSALMWAPFFAVWSVYVLWKNPKILMNLIAAGVLGIGLSAFFILPAFLERDLVGTHTLVSGDLDYRLHFASVGQLFLDRSWGYGASKPGPNDDLSLQIGWPHWWVVAAGVVYLTYLYTKKRIKKDKLLLPGVLGLSFFLSLLMTHNKSTFIWEHIKLLGFVQFPWRFLGICVFFTSLFGGYLVYLVDNKKSVSKKYLLAVSLVTLTVILNISYFSPKTLYLDATDDAKLTGGELEGQKKGAILDYLPKSAKVPQIVSDGQPKVIVGDVEVKNFYLTSDSWRFETKNSGGDFEVEVPVFNFPEWRSNYDIYTSENGRIVVRGSEDSEVYGYFENTKIRNIGNSITLLSIFTLLVYSSYGIVKKNN